MSATSPAAARYALTYGPYPKKAAEALTAARAHAQEARQLAKHSDCKPCADKARLEAEEWEEIGDALEAVLAKRDRCRLCGRALRDPVSVCLGIGPECARKVAE